MIIINNQHQLKKKKQKFSLAKQKQLGFVKFYLLHCEAISQKIVSVSDTQRHFVKN